MGGFDNFSVSAQWKLKGSALMKRLKEGDSIKLCAISLNAYAIQFLNGREIRFPDSFVSTRKEQIQAEMTFNEDSFIISYSSITRLTLDLFLDNVNHFYQYPSELKIKLKFHNNQSPSKITPTPRNNLSTPRNNLSSSFRDITKKHTPTTNSLVRSNLLSTSPENRKEISHRGMVRGEDCDPSYCLDPIDPIESSPILNHGNYNSAYSVINTVSKSSSNSHLQKKQVSLTPAKRPHSSFHHAFSPHSCTRFSPSLHFNNSNRPIPKVSPKLGGGFANLGNTCYINAVLQSFVSLHLFERELKRPIFMNSNLSSSSLYRQLVNLFSIRESKTAIDISNIKKTIGHSNSAFAGSGQQDAHEFFTEVINRLSIEFSLDDKSTPPFDWLPTDRTFGIELDYHLVCSKCSHDRHISELSTNLSLDIPNQFKICDKCNQKVELLANSTQCICPCKATTTEIPLPFSIPALLDTFFSFRHLEYHCDVCNDCDDVELKPSIKLLPRILVLHLKRFVINESCTDYVKCEDAVSILTKIDLEPYCNDNTLLPLDFTDEPTVDIPDNDYDAALNQALEASRQLNRAEMDEDEQIKLALEMSLAESKFLEETMQTETEKDSKIEHIELSEIPEIEKRSLKNTNFRPNSYSLSAICKHKGNARGGHYFTDVYLRKTNRWRRFNDSIVRYISEKDALVGEAKSQGYFLFFELNL